MISVEDHRLLVRDIARTWLGTPYHHQAAVKGAGVDCARILIEVYAEAGLMASYKPERYTKDWYFHRNEEKYLKNIEDHAGLPIKDNTSIHLWADEKYRPLMGDMLVWRVGRTFSHGGIVSNWPNIIHASAPSRMVEEVSVINTVVHERPVKVYSFWRNR